MRKRPIRLKESDIMNIVKRVIRERSPIVAEQDFGSPWDSSTNNTNSVMPVIMGGYSDSSGSRVQIGCPSGYAFMKDDGTLALGNSSSNDPFTQYGSSSNNPSRYVVLTRCYPIQKTNPPSPTSPRPPRGSNPTNPGTIVPARGRDLGQSGPFGIDEQKSGARPNKGGSNICSELPADFPSDEELENNFALQNPEEYEAIEDKYIAGGGRPGDARWVAFFFRMGFPKGLLWDELTYDLPTSC